MLRRASGGPQGFGRAMVVAVTCVFVAAACSATGPVSAPPTVAPAAAPGGAPSPGPSVPAASSSPSRAPLDAATGPTHDAVELEVVIPKRVAGRELSTWSVRGENFLRLNGFSTQKEIADAAAEFAANGVDIETVAAAIAGRRDVQHDPPYLITVFRFGDRPASELPLSLGVDHPEGGGWHSSTLGGKVVDIGTVEMVDQTESLHGLPYVYSTGVYRFVIASDDPAWAADVLAQLQ